MELKSKYLTSGLKCPGCGSAGFDLNRAPEQSLVCNICAARYAIDDGVVRMDKAALEDPVSAFYDTCGGSHFVGTTFESNPLIYITTRAYCKFLENLALCLSKPILDFGCGDGRLSLWAAEKKFVSVVSVDSNLASLKRLAAEVRQRGLDNLLIVCADAARPPLQEGFFETVLCFEVLYYLVPTLGRQQAIRTPAELLSPTGTMIVSEFSRFGRAIIDVDSLNLENARSLVHSSTRWEKFADSRLETFLWSMDELEADFLDAGLTIVSKTGISLAAALFSYAWTFTTYPLRPPLDTGTRELIEAISDRTQGACDAARNIVYALGARR
jgi:2-polyprenyl-3-methyl-5-hydroxy-6-metoxy-1,4-benzoquinol methylase